MAKYCAASWLSRGIRTLAVCASLPSISPGSRAILRILVFGSPVLSGCLRPQRYYILVNISEPRVRLRRPAARREGAIKLMRGSRWRGGFANSSVTRSTGELALLKCAVAAQVSDPKVKATTSGAADGYDKLAQMEETRPAESAKRHKIHENSV